MSRNVAGTHAECTERPGCRSGAPPEFRDVNTTVRALSEWAFHSFEQIRRNNASRPGAATATVTFECMSLMKAPKATFSDVVLKRTPCRKRRRSGADRRSELRSRNEYARSTSRDLPAPALDRHAYNHACTEAEAASAANAPGQRYDCEKSDAIMR